jgi:1-aminocyclopropane-1-carboxylate deaminase
VQPRAHRDHSLRCLQRVPIFARDGVGPKVGNILLSRIMGAEVRLDPAGFDIGSAHLRARGGPDLRSRFRDSWEQALTSEDSLHSTHIPAPSN